MTSLSMQGQVYADLLLTSDELKSGHTIYSRDTSRLINIGSCSKLKDPRQVVLNKSGRSFGIVLLAVASSYSGRDIRPSLLESSAPNPFCLVCKTNSGIICHPCQIQPRVSLKREHGRVLFLKGPRDILAALERTNELGHVAVIMHLVDGAVELAPAHR